MSHERTPYRAQPATMTAEQFQATVQAKEPETRLQRRCVKWFCDTYPQLMIQATPNKAARTKSERGSLLAEGMVAGWPDLMVAYPHNGKPGLFIELKTLAKHSKPSDNQIKVQAYLRGVGYEVAMPRTFDEFQQIVIEYLKES